MAYFDSSKNKALWEIRLGQLRKERAARLAGGGGTAFKEEAEKNMTGSVRVPISYQELLKREAMESGKKRERGTGEKTREMTQVQEKQKERQVLP